MQKQCVIRLEKNSKGKNFCIYKFSVLELFKEQKKNCLTFPQKSNAFNQTILDNDVMLIIRNSYWCDFAFSLDTMIFFCVPGKAMLFKNNTLQKLYIFIEYIVVYIYCMQIFNNSFLLNYFNLCNDSGFFVSLFLTGSGRSLGGENLKCLVQVLGLSLWVYSLQCQKQIL